MTVEARSTRGRVDRLLRLALGAKGANVPVEFTERGRTFRCVVPDDALWSGVLFVLLLRAYERSGICLADVDGSIVDAGAHVGLFTLQAAAYGRRVIAFEPNPATYDLLLRNVDRLDIEVITRNAAVSDRAGTVELHEGRDSVSASISTERNSGSGVPSLALDDIITEYAPVGLLKMNIEGAEYDALAAASDETLRRVDRLAVELHNAEDGSVGPVVDRLRALGFEVRVELPLFYGWRESCLKILANRRLVRNFSRLKMTALFAFTASMLARPVFDVATAVDTDRLRYLFAVRH